MNYMIQAAKDLFGDGWGVDLVREYLRSNYVNATMSAVEEAIQSAQQGVKPTVEGNDEPTYHPIRMDGKQA